MAELVKEGSPWFPGMIGTVAHIKALVYLKFCWMLSAQVVYLSCKIFGENICKYLFSCYLRLQKVVLFNDPLSWSIIHRIRGFNYLCNCYTKPPSIKKKTNVSFCEIINRQMGVFTHWAIILEISGILSIRPSTYEVYDLRSYEKKKKIFQWYREVKISTLWR